MKPSDTPVNSPQFWELYFEQNWEKNDGRMQTRLFAKYFLEKMELPTGVTTLLDVGCGMGDAAAEFHARYPELQITGCDVSAQALAKAQESYGAFATFRQWTFEQIEGRYDAIYCSNTLEHFENHMEIASKLLERCDHLFVLVPYMELRHGKRLTPRADEQHVATFDRRSFDALQRSGAAASIESVVTRAPGAWESERVSLKTKIRHWLRGQRAPREYMQIFFHIRRAASGAAR